MLSQDVHLAGRYRLDRRVGRGGMAEVWAAEDAVLEREVAVKVLSTKFADDEQFQLRFRREAQQAASLNHPNIVSVYDTGTHDGLPFIVMELVRGRSLQQVLLHGGLTEERSLEVCADVCAALAFAHGHGLVHRDVKPGNILLADDGTVKVTDFGIARAIASETVTQTASVLGTAAYLSPEQAQGAQVDTRSDIYSLGIVLYEALTGRQPFQGDSAVGVAYQHVQENPIPPREWDPSISATAEAIAIKAMAKNPTNRYGSAAEMREDLLRARTGQSVTAPAVLLADETAVLDADVMTSRKPPLTATQQRRRRATGYVLLAILTVLAFAVGIWFLATGLGGEQTVLRTVPNIIGQSPADAEEDLAARGLEGRFAGEDYDPEGRIPVGRVLRQEPQPGEQVEDGSIVRYVLSRGREPVTIPDVRNAAEQDAIATLRNAGLVVGDRVTEFSDDIEQGRVLRTEPGIGERVEKGSTVTLVVSAGEETEIVPNVVGLLEADARFQLEERGFQPLVVEEFSDTVDEGRVIRQEPEGNTEQPVGEEVAIVVSKGSAEPTPSPSPTPSPTPSPSPSPSPSPTPTETEPPPSPSETASPA